MVLFIVVILMVISFAMKEWIHGQGSRFIAMYTEFLSPSVMRLEEISHFTDTNSFTHFLS